MTAFCHDIFLYCLPILQMQLLIAMLSMARGLGPSYWTMWAALALSLDFGNAPVMELAFITVPTLKMQVSAVRFNVSDIDITRDKDLWCKSSCQIFLLLSDRCGREFRTVFGK